MSMDNTPPPSGSAANTSKMVLHMPDSEIKKIRSFYTSLGIADDQAFLSEIVNNSINGFQAEQEKGVVQRPGFSNWSWVFTLLTILSVGLGIYWYKKRQKKKKKRGRRARKRPIAQSQPSRDQNFEPDIVEDPDDELNW